MSEVMRKQLEFNSSSGLDLVLDVVITSVQKGCSLYANRHNAVSDQEYDARDLVEYYVDNLSTYNDKDELQQEMFIEDFLDDIDHIEIHERLIQILGAGQ